MYNIIVMLLIVGVLFLISVKYINKKVNATVQATTNQLSTSIEEIDKGLNYYKKESELWYSRYVEDVNKRVVIERELMYIKKEVKTLRYIVDKMDGRVIDRDNSYNIKSIKIVK